MAVEENTQEGKVCRDDCDDTRKDGDQRADGITRKF